MHFGPAPDVLIAAIACASILLMLVRPRGIPEVYWVGSGALLLVLLRLISIGSAVRAVREGTDVYLFLIGMMLLSELARENGLFDWLSSAAVRKARGSPKRLFLLVYGIGTVVTAFMSNDATAVVLTPAVLHAVRKARAAPLPYLFACAFIANAASFVLPISNPANLVVFHNRMPPLGAWLLSFALPSVVSIVTTYFVLAWIFQNDISGEVNGSTEEVKLDTNGRMVLIALAAVVAVLLCASALRLDLGLPTCVTALVVTAAVCLKERTSPWKLFREISWTTIALVAGLFVLLDAAEKIGALQFTQGALRWVEQLPQVAGALLTSLVVGVANNLINNLPVGLLAGSTLQASHVSRLLESAVLIGVDVGPNLSITGSLATILWLIALRREDVNVSFKQFLRIGAVAMPVAVASSTLASVLMARMLGR